MRLLRPSAEDTGAGGIEPPRLVSASHLTAI